MRKSTLPVSCLGSVYIGSRANEVILSIESLVANYFADQVIVVIDGCIISELHEVLQDYESREIIHCLYLPENHGLGMALREGLKHCRNELVVRFDTDDINDPERLNILYQASIQHPSIDIIGSYVYEFTPLESNNALIGLKKVPCDHKRICRSLTVRNSLNHPSVAFRRSSILKIDSYQHMPLFEDYYLWLRARRHGLQFLNLGLPLVYMRRTNTLERRSGSAYLKLELSFLRTIMAQNLLSPIYVAVFLLRLALRALPRRLQMIQNFMPWRSRRFIGLNPELNYTYGLNDN